VNLVIGLAYPLCQSLLGTAGVWKTLLEGLDRDLGGDLAGLSATHAVGDHEHRRARERVVLIVAALATGVGPQRYLCRAKHL
jgi:hypothetical protein